MRGSAKKTSPPSNAKSKNSRSTDKHFSPLFLACTKGRGVAALALVTSLGIQFAHFDPATLASARSDMLIFLAVMALIGLLGHGVGIALAWLLETLLRMVLRPLVRLAAGYGERQREPLCQNAY